MYTPKSIRKNAKAFSSDPPNEKIKRVVLDFERKEKVIKKLKLGFTPDKLALEFGIAPITVYKLKVKEENLRKYREENPYSPTRKTIKFSSFPNIDKTLKIWFYQQRELNRPVNLMKLSLKSIEFYEKLYPDPKNRKKFDGSIGYVQKFLQRNSIKLRHMHGENESCDNQAAEKYKKEFPSLTLGYTNEQIYNCDESGLIYFSLPSKTYVTPNEDKVKG